jgi:hypothetical protein
VHINLIYIKDMSGSVSALSAAEVCELIAGVEDLHRDLRSVLKEEQPAVAAHLEKCVAELADAKLKRVACRWRSELEGRRGR